MSQIDISKLKIDLPWYSNDELAHYGTPRHSGRYPWGSGDNPYQHSSYFLSQVEDMRKKGMSDKEIYTAMGMNSTEFRNRLGTSRADVNAAMTRQALKLHDHGYSNTKIAEMMGVSEGSIRNWLKKPIDNRQNKYQRTADILRECVNEKGMIDVGKGSERVLGVSNECLKKAIDILKDEGYVLDNRIYIQQATDEHQFTPLRVLARPGMTHQEITANRFDVQSIDNYYTDDGGKTWYGIEEPKSIDSSRIYIRYKDDQLISGSEKDGLIELRRGVEDISLGDGIYAQVRIAVDGKSYMKGMAVYSDDIPEGYDVIYNTNKLKGTPLFEAPKGYETVFKEMKTIDIVNDDGSKTKAIDKDNPFGSLIMKDGQRHYTNPETGEKELSVINKIRDEGQWDEWGRNLPTQFLGKQNIKLIENQLNLSLADRNAEFDEIMSLENNGIKKKLLISFADGCDSSAVDLKAKSLPGQAVQVLLPDPNIKDGEIYAPNYKDGSYVALVRYPHSGTFEIPMLKVNNNVESAKRMLSADGEGRQAVDAVVINSKTAAKLSGADFDGDTVTVIPTHGSNGVKISSSGILKGLENFDPKESYPYHEGIDIMKKSNLGKQMGVISNLITDMTIKGASKEELARAVRHSMVVVDAPKHKLDYKQSYIDNGIQELQITYQGKPTGGASTLFSQAKSQFRVNKRKEGVYVTDENGKTHLVKYDPETGEKLYRETGDKKTKLSAAGKKRLAAIDNDTSLDEDERRTRRKEVYADEGHDIDIQIVSTKMAEKKDAHELSSGDPKEELYADYANSLKALANKARKAFIDVPDVERDPIAAKKYSPQVESLRRKIDIAILNSPKERQAQIIANKRLREKQERDPSLKDDKKTLKKVKSQLINQARTEVGAKGKESKIEITDAEWEAIQSKAVSKSMLNTILAYTDEAKVRERATPKANNTLSLAKEAKIKALSNAGFSAAQIAEQMNLSKSRVIDVLKPSN